MRLLGRLRPAPAEPACSHVLTPARIPEFCIPPRLLPPCAPESPPPAAALPRRCAAEPDLWPRGADAAAGHTDWDPRSQAALSLPHLPRGRTAYGFCALLESPHTRRKESLFLGGPGAAPPPPPPPPPGAAPAAAAAPALPARPRPRPRPAPRAPAPPARARRLLRAPEGLLSRALRARGSRGLARARSACGGDRDEPPSRAGAPSASASASPSPSPPAAPPPPPPGPDPRPERLEAEGTVALGRAGGALRLAAEYSRASGRLRVRLLGAEGRAAGPGAGGAAGAAEPRAVGCRVSFVLRPPGQTRPRRSAVVRPSRAAASEQDVWLDGLSEEQLRRLAVRVQAEERGRLRGQGELLLGALLLPAGPGLRPPPRA
ncbi:LOW QUALITY PROTEIN: C2 calcium-dependent domain-containing protein 4A-like [Canis lupus familiaris]|uniref:LOW QUALITY PROTEIN: C2 calcium-dependent domain-containing protein 4A-like n=1 Tax=Canis lupus familiaris TaxID=9615 RepID=UPI0018F40CDE|nr:LOW QUALITY PROTEIN: C2 calcium-dependent domain-containing protein 4A-like [Canis lupus familiaris]